MPSPTQITPTQLFRLIGTPIAPTIIDVCIDEDFEADPRLVPTAIRHNHSRICELVPVLKDQKIVVICQKGLKLSMGAAALLRANGLDAESLEGGNFAWRDAGYPLVPAKNIPLQVSIDHTRWVTRHRPKIDRIACPWLIRRFIDPKAQFLFVAPSQVMDVAEKFDATPFDVEGVFWSHRQDLCTFDTMLKEFCLETEALNHLATIIRAADTNNHALAPEAAGLLAASLGLSRMYKDDLEQLDAGLLLYDAFYRWARDARDESHDWPTTSQGAK